MAHVSLRGLPPHRLRANRAPIPPRRASALPTHTSADPRARAYVRARAGGWRACARGRGVRGAAAIPPRGLGAAANTYAPFPSHPATPTLLPPPTHRPTHPASRPPPNTRPAARPLARSLAPPQLLFSHSLKPNTPSSSFTKLTLLAEVCCQIVLRIDNALPVVIATGRRAEGSSSLVLET